MQRDEHEEQIEPLPEDDNTPMELLIAVTEVLLQMLSTGAINLSMLDTVHKKLEFVKDNYVS